MNLAAWNAGATLGLLAIALWWHAYGVEWWRTVSRWCFRCGRAVANCSCVEVVFEPWDEDDDVDEDVAA